MASISKRGEYQFRALIRRKGQTISKTFYYKNDAEVWARKVESEIDRGIFINTQEAERLTLAELIDRFEAEVLPTMKSQAQEMSRLRIIRTALGSKIIGTITDSAIRKYRNERLNRIKENSVNREVTTLKRLLSFAQNDCKITLPHGLPQIRKLDVDDSRERRVSDAEIEAIIAHTDSSELPAIIQVALYTAMRRSSIVKLKRKNLNLSVPSMRLENTKNSKNLTVPLLPEAAAVFKSLPVRLDGSVFKLKDDSITQAFERARVRARAAYEAECRAKSVKPCDRFLIDLHFHDLRHEATSRLASLLPNVIELSRVTGHKDLKMLDRYYLTSVEDLAAKLKVSSL